jgi:hypothetical protein
MLGFFLVILSEKFDYLPTSTTKKKKSVCRGVKVVHEQLFGRSIAPPPKIKKKKSEIPTGWK